MVFVESFHCFEFYDELIRYPKISKVISDNGAVFVMDT